MTDLVTRLRSFRARCWGEEGEVIDAALAEIERLRTALRNLLDDTQHAEHCCEDADCPVKAARAALRD